jgi:two-component system, sensor histidine kinase and response regulator
VPPLPLLLVDDRSDSLLALEAVLEPLGLPILRVGSGDEALRLLLTHEVSVIVLDVQMPGLDGFETATRIKERDRTRDIPIIFLTAISQGPEHRLRGFATGAVDYLLKPIDPDVLRAKVAIFAELSNRRRALEEELVARRAAEAALARKTAELERSNADLEQFSYVASHDLQEPLRVASGFLELISERLGPGLDPEAADWMARVRRAAGHMSELIAGMLTYARAGAGTPAPVPFDLDESLQLALEHLGPRLAEQGADVRCQPLGKALGSPTETAQVFQNLLHNALKFSGGKPPLVEITSEDADGEVIVSMADRGMGVAAEHLERVFGMFERVEGEPYPGTGLGLATCRKLVERQGGRIWMEVNDDRGVTVSFTLPAARP